MKRGTGNPWRRLGLPARVGWLVVAVYGAAGLLVIASWVWGWHGAYATRPLDEIVSRLSGRRTCRECTAVFHVTAQPPRAAGLCDHCGGALYQREDDRPESITVRMEAYQRSTLPLIQFYSRLGLLLPVSAAGTPDEIYARTMTAVAACA